MFNQQIGLTGRKRAVISGKLKHAKCQKDAANLRLMAWFRDKQKHIHRNEMSEWNDDINESSLSS